MDKETLQDLFLVIVTLAVIAMMTILMVTRTIAADNPLVEVTLSPIIGIWFTYRAAKFQVTQTAQPLILSSPPIEARTLQEVQQAQDKP